jgi:hypothetical protein
VIADVSPRRVVVEPGVPAVLVVSVTNTGGVIAGYDIDVLGLDPAWTTVGDQPLSLFPGDAGTCLITVELPLDAPAGTRILAVQIRDTTNPSDVAVVDVDVTVPQRHATTIELDPAALSAGTLAKFGIILQNSGNGIDDLVLLGSDDDDEVRFNFQPPTLRLAPGDRAVVTAEVRAKRPFTGSPKIRTLNVSARFADGQSIETMGSLVQRPVISRGAFGLLGLLVAVSVFAAVIATTFGRVADRSAADRNLLLDAIAGEGEGAGGVPGSIAGTVTLLTSGQPADGVTIDAFPADDLTTAAGTTATNTAGDFDLPGLSEGKYKLRARGAGFIDVWYPLALDPDAATEVDVKAGQASRGTDIRVGGVPASLEGKVNGKDVAGAIVNVRIPAGSIPGVPIVVAADGTIERGPVVASAPVDASGIFKMADIPSPATYELTAEKEGFATQSQLINLAAGEARDSVTFELRTGDGTITGHVNSADGPLGGATITATDGTTSVSTVSLTRDDIGGFTLRALPTPGTYTLVVSKAGFTTATLTVNLPSKGSRSGVDTTLVSGAGSISGKVQAAGVGPAGGVRVRASDGQHTVETVSLSTGDVGAYHLTGLAVPGTYTVTFERDDLARQTRAVSLDRSSRRDVTGEDVSLTLATGTVKGVVRDSQNNLAGNVTVELIAGEKVFRTTSTTDPPGEYEFRGVPPGTHSVTFTRGGSAPTGLLATVTAGGTTEVNAVLVARASIRGTVFFPNGVTPRAGVIVRLFRQEDYDSGPVVRTVSTGTDGTYEFTDLDSPAVYIVDFGLPNQPVATSRQVVLEAGEDEIVGEPPNLVTV